MSNDSFNQTAPTKIIILLTLITIFTGCEGPYDSWGYDTTSYNPPVYNPPAYNPPVYNQTIDWRLLLPPRLLFLDPSSAIELDIYLGGIDEYYNEQLSELQYQLQDMQDQLDELEYDRD